MLKRLTLIKRKSSKCFKQYFKHKEGKKIFPDQPVIKNIVKSLQSLNVQLDNLKIKDIKLIHILEHM